MTTQTPPFALLQGLNPSCSDLNALILGLSAILSKTTAQGSTSVSGNLSVTGTTSLTGNTTESGTLTVTGLSTLNGGISGGSGADIAINTNKLTVQASTGNTLIAGTLAVTGATTLTGTLTTVGHTARSVSNALTAAGTTRTDSLALTADVNNVTTAASGTGVTLPAGVVGEEIVVLNAGANPIKVYGNGSDTVDSVAGATGVTLTNGKRAVFLCVAANTVVSAQLGVVSA